ncbi:sensor histidine kinase [Exilibacterium tricleocarpae]|uniref:sensor histidine kinase n=1 Tax=Exilibacterium tricleocarpae TaxID=2591008 RepID=UPI0015D15A32|nr:sensor histidine kinase [Exilibacterium tricleocarpae]
MATAILLLVLVPAAPAFAASGSDAGGGEAVVETLVETVVTHLSHALNPGTDLRCDEAAQRLETIAFSPTDGLIDYGFSPAQVLVKINLRNISAVAQERVIDLNSTFWQSITVCQIAAGAAPAELLRLHRDAPFGQRLIAYRNLVIPVVTDAGAEQTLLLAYRSGGTAQMKIDIYDRQAFFYRSVSETAQLMLFVGAAAFMVLYSFLNALKSATSVYIAYAVYVTTVVLYVIHMEGVSFQYLWPDSPRWNAVASAYLGLGAILFAVLFGVLFLDLRRRFPALFYLALAHMGVTLAALVIFSFGWQQVIKKWAFMISLAGGLLCCGFGVYSWIKGYREVRFYVLGWSILFAAGLLLTANHWLSGFMAVQVGYELTRWAVLVEIALFALALADQSSMVRRAYQHSLVREAELSASKARVTARLLESEKQRGNMLERLREQARYLATATHDMRQPLAAFKLSLANLAGDQPLEERQVAHMKQCVDYLDEVVEQTLEGELSRSGELLREDAAVDSVAERFELSDVLDNVAYIFGKEAAKKNIAFHYLGTSVVVEANPTTVMRIVSNLVSNAVKYTPAGRVVLGVRRRAGEACIEVWDTGPGIDARRLPALYRPLQQENSAAEGSGLGLAAVKALSESMRCTLTIHPKNAAAAVVGTHACLCLPRPVL